MVLSDVVEESEWLLSETCSDFDVRSRDIGCPYTTRRPFLMHSSWRNIQNLRGFLSG
jgi:hypothetical protein